MRKPHSVDPCAACLKGVFGFIKRVDQIIFKKTGTIPKQRAFQTCFSKTLSYGRYASVHRATNLCLKNCAGAVPACATEVVFDVAALRGQTEMAMKSLAAGPSIVIHTTRFRSTFNV